ncbi:hypothetical protein ACGFI9_37385 [Micromonospora sp. NPDC048930]|uniref:hypothetical protein n=1 Tax=Micromonospora sp. NPDC048930 TaxID=3364261 RepID=UPI003715849F
MTPIRDQIIDILAPHAAGCQDADCSMCDDAMKRADLVLAAIATWMTEPGHDFRLSLALAEAAPGRFDYGVHGDAELTDAAMAVAAELAKALRPAQPEPDTADRPAVADRYAVLAGGGL